MLASFWFSNNNLQILAYILTYILAYILAYILVEIEPGTLSL